MFWVPLVALTRLSHYITALTASSSLSQHPRLTPDLSCPCTASPHLATSGPGQCHSVLTPVSAVEAEAPCGYGGVGQSVVVVCQGPVIPTLFCLLSRQSKLYPASMPHILTLKCLLYTLPRQGGDDFYFEFIALHHTARHLSTALSKSCSLSS